MKFPATVEITFTKLGTVHMTLNSARLCSIITKCTIVKFCINIVRTKDFKQQHHNKTLPSAHDTLASARLQSMIKYTKVKFCISWQPKTAGISSIVSQILVQCTRHINLSKNGFYDHVHSSKVLYQYRATDVKWQQYFTTLGTVHMIH